MPTTTTKPEVTAAPKDEVQSYGRALKALLTTPDYAVAITKQPAFTANLPGHDAEILSPGYIVETTKPKLWGKPAPVDSFRLEHALKQVCRKMKLDEIIVQRTQHGVYISRGTVQSLMDAYIKLDNERGYTDMMVGGFGPSLDLQLKAIFTTSLSTQPGCAKG